MGEILTTLGLFILLYGLGLAIAIILIVLKIIFIVRVWKIVKYHYFKIKEEERIQRVKQKYFEIVEEEKEPSELEEPKEKKTVKEKVNNFLFREDE